MDKAQVVVIGGGPGGYVAAFRAADLGLNTTLIDPEKNPGGVCLYRGCIPSKALLHVASLINEAKDAHEWGIGYSAPRIDLNRLRAWKNEVIEKNTNGLGELVKRRKINHIRGWATFKDSNTLTIRLVEGGEQELAFEHAVLATGSSPTVIPSFDIGNDRIMDSTGALELADIPKRMLVIGGGYIGLEMATAYSALGTKITVVEMLKGLLPGADKDLVRHVEKRAKTIFDDVLLETTVAGVEESGNKIKVSFKAKDGTTSDDEFDRVLVAVGRRPNSTGLGLENTAAQVTDRGFLEVDAQRRTADPNIYAIGDIAGEPMLAHKASHEGIVAVESIAGHNVAFEPQAIPAVVFTDPEIAWCGLTENIAKERNIPVTVARFPWAASGRATANGRNDGVTKLLIDPESERVLGVGIAGVGAGELIAEGVIAVEMAALASDVALSIHPHPTLSETIMEAAEAFYGHATHIFNPKRG
jgi:dihydrolipoamide dehydrogenase